MSGNEKIIDYKDIPAIMSAVDLKNGKASPLLAGRTAVVTGGGKGIGKGISIRLAAAGAKIIIVGRSNMAMAEETAAQIRTDGGEAYTIEADLSLQDTPKKVIAFAVEKFGGVDILINNAAYQPNLDIDEYTADKYEYVQQVNLFAYLRMISAALPFLKKNGEGRIVNISSVHGKRPTGFDFGYSSSKGGIYMLTRETAVELQKYGITCNSILPGGTAIEFKSGDTASFKHLRVERPRRYKYSFRYGTPSDTANLCVFLCSSLAEHYNGVAVRADGGMMLY